MDLFEFLMLLGGLGLFLYGMKLMSDGLEAAAGDKLRVYLEKLTTNRFAAVGVGAGVTAVIQSSSATTVMLIGFVNAGLMTIQQSVFVGMGANIGTTMTAQLVAFKITDWAPLILFAGVLMLLFGKKRQIKRIGQIIGGLGILFFGMNVMSEAVIPLREWEPFVDLLSSFSNPAVGILAGALVTCAIQSSSATMGIMQAFAMQGIVGLEQGMYVCLGANIGTCITALLASLGTSRTAKRTAVAFLIFNLIGVGIFSVLLNVLPIQQWVYSWTPNDPVRQLANFHTLFNVLTTCCLIGFPNVLVKLSGYIVRGKDKEREEKSLKYLNRAMLSSPPVAVGQAIREVRRMAKIAYSNVNKAKIAFINKEEELINETFEGEEVVNYLSLEITNYLAKLGREELSDTDSRNVLSLIEIVTDVERISDHAENIAQIAETSINKKLEFSKEAISEIEIMSSTSINALKNAVEGLNTGDIDAANEVIRLEQEVDDYDSRYNKLHIKRLSKGECDVKCSTVFTEMLHNLERIADHSTNIAYEVLSRHISE